jgi:chloride channel 7
MFKFLVFFCFVYSLLLVVLASSNVQIIQRHFRGLGLRHLPIVNDTNEVIRMVTRKDLARYRVWRHQDRMGVEELLISKEI